MKTCSYCGHENASNASICGRCANHDFLREESTQQRTHAPPQLPQKCLRCGSARVIHCNPNHGEYAGLVLSRSDRRTGFFGLRKFFTSPFHLSSDATVCLDCGCVVTQLEPFMIRDIVRRHGRSELLARLGLAPSTDSYSNQA